MNLRKLTLYFLAITLLATPGFAKKQPKYEPAHQLTADQAALVERAIGREKVLIKSIQQRTPLVETYIQNTRPDVKLYHVPLSDSYMLSRVDFGKGFFDKGYQPRGTKQKGFFKNSLASITGLTKALGLDTKYTYNPLGFTEMMFLDPSGFDQAHYQFSYVRREFLGSVRTWVFDVHPKVSGMGRFYGRVWIEDQDGNIVRFNGTFTGPTNEGSSEHYFHFDSWRMNVQPGIWLPVAVYVEESERTESQKAVGLKAQTHFWGYNLKLPTRDSENVSVATTRKNPGVLAAEINLRFRGIGIGVPPLDSSTALTDDAGPIQNARSWPNDHITAYRGVRRHPGGGCYLWKLPA
jgi:hypothetical protein